MPAIIHVQGRFPWLVRRPSADRRWIAVCDPLNLAMEADTLDELYSVIHEALHLLMRDLLADNEIESFFRQRGWEISDIPQSNSADDVQFALPPIELIMQNVHGSERRAH